MNVEKKSNFNRNFQLNSYYMIQNVTSTRSWVVSKPTTKTRKKKLKLKIKIFNYCYNTIFFPDSVKKPQKWRRKKNNIHAICNVHFVYISLRLSLIFLIKIISHVCGLFCAFNGNRYLQLEIHHQCFENISIFESFLCVGHKTYRY